MNTYKDADYGCCELCCQRVTLGRCRLMETFKEHIYVIVQAVLVTARYIGIFIFGLFSIAMMLFHGNSEDEETWWQREEDKRRKREEDEELDRLHYEKLRNELNNMEFAPGVSHEDALHDDALVNKVNGLVRGAENGTVDPRDIVRAATEELYPTRMRNAEVARSRSYNLYKEANFIAAQNRDEAFRLEKEGNFEGARIAENVAKDAEYAADRHYRDYLA